MWRHDSAAQALSMWQVRHGNYHCGFFGRGNRRHRSSPASADRRRSPRGCSPAALVFAMVVVGGVTRLTHSGPVDRRMAAAGRRDPAAQRRRLAATVREVPAHARISAGELQHGPRRVQAHLLVGVLPPAARPRHRRRVPAADAVVPVATLDRPAARLEARRRLRPRRSAGRDGLVHGEERPGGRPARVAVPPHRAPRPRAADLRRDVLDCAGSAFSTTQLLANAARYGCPRVGHRHPS